MNYIILYVIEFLHNTYFVKIKKKIKMSICQYKYEIMYLQLILYNTNL